MGWFVVATMVSVSPIIQIIHPEGNLRNAAGAVMKHDPSAILWRRLNRLPHHLPPVGFGFAAARVRSTSNA